MFEVGQYIIYGYNGVCQVEAMGLLDKPGFNHEQLYYTLCPVYMRGTKIYTPVNNDKVVMRPILTNQEAMNLIQQMDQIGEFSTHDDKLREIEYKDALRTCECIPMIRVIKTIYSRNKQKLAQGKKATVGEDRYFHKAEDSLYQELAVALKMEKDEIKDFIIKTMEAKQLNQWYETL